MSNSEATQSCLDGERSKQKTCDEQRVRVKLVLFNYKVHNKIHTNEIPVDCRNMIDILNYVLSDERVIQDVVGYKMLGDIETECTALDIAGVTYHYLIETTLGQVYQLVKVFPMSSDHTHHYFIQAQPFTLSPVEFHNCNKLLPNLVFGDVMLCVSGIDIPAHKMRLSNKSPVFKAIFEQTDVKCNTVEIPHVDCDMILDLLYFIYKGKIRPCENDLFTKCANLLKVDSQFCVTDLKSMCEARLSCLLSTDNVLQCLILADSNNACNLEKRAIDFTVQHVQEITESPKYKNFAVLHPKILLKIIKALALTNVNAYQ